MSGHYDGSHGAFEGGADTDSLETKEVYDPNYRAALRKFFMDAMNSNQDLSVDHEGDLILIENRLVLYRYKWNSKTKSFEKVYTGSRSRKKDYSKSSSDLKDKFSDNNSDSMSDVDEEEFAS